jgi:multiple sugar transport system substrate-binding protein
MAYRDNATNNLLQSEFSRRSLLRGMMASAILTAGSAAISPALASPTSRSAQATENFAGVTLQVASGVTSGQVADAAAKVWQANTGGAVVVNKIPGSDRIPKYASYIATQDSSIDVIYAYSDYIGQFGTRLYEDLTPIAGDTSDFVPGTLKVLSNNGKLLALPIHSEVLLFIYNKAYFKDAGIDPEHPPTTWPELFALADKLHVQNRYACAIPWLEGTLTYFDCFLNSTPTKLLSDDRTQATFNNADGLLAFQTINDGFTSKFFDPNAFQLTSGYDTGLLFNSGQVASEVNFAELWGQAVSGDVANFKATLDPAVVGATTLPGINAGTSGSCNGYEGFGVSKFSKQKDAALSFVKTMASAEVQKPINLAKTLPSARISVLSDPDVAQIYPIGSVLANQGTYNVDRYSAPYNVGPVFDDAITKMFKGDFTPQQALDAAYSGTNDLIIKYLSS